MRCEICGEGASSDGLPDSACWDSNALPDQVHEWVRRLRDNPRDGARQFLGRIGSPGAADALRSYLAIDDPRILALIVGSLGWSGDISDGPALIRLIGHEDEDVRRRVMESLAELGVKAAIGPLSARLDVDSLEKSERGGLVECLAWMGHTGVLPYLRQILQMDGVRGELGKYGVARSLSLVGDESDRAEIGRIAIATLDRSAREGFVQRRQERTLDWDVFVQVVGAVAPDEVEAAKAGLSDGARLALTWHPFVAPVPDVAGAALGRLVRPRKTISSFVEVRPRAIDGPPAKFFGQPDWRDRPTWPVGGDGSLLMFYGQLPVAQDRTAYLFTAGPNEWDALGPGSALIVQPGGGCHLPTVEQAEGPRFFDWLVSHDRFIPRARRGARPERFVVWSDGSDPDEFPRGADSSTEHWNKVGGSPVWLQSDATPGPGWDFAFQVEAGFAGNERGDGAVLYGWVNERGEGALGWQSH